jgi:REP element-mobilizing transposase RayT
MGNHVHALLLPIISPARLLGALKGCTARQANLVLGQTGQPFWQAESYDHWVRDERELEKIVGYIENNPVKAGFVARPEDYPWSSAAEPAARDGKSPLAAGTSAYATSTSPELLHTPRE